MDIWALTEVYFKGGVGDVVKPGAKATLLISCK